MKSKIENEFRSRFGGSPTLFISPGRINLLGEHVDYNNGLALPTAIDKSIFFAVAPNQKNEFNFFAINLNESATFSLAELNPDKGWVTYCKGVVHGLKARNSFPGGFDCVFGGDIPEGAGLSSSAALCCGLGFALNEVFNLGLSRLELAKVGQYAEHKFAGANVGLMDQYASLLSTQGHVMLLDFHTLTHTFLSLQLRDHVIVLINSLVKHEIASTAYNERRKACEEGVNVLRVHDSKINSLRDVSLDLLLRHRNDLGEEVFHKCRYVVEEIERVKKAARHLKEGDLVSFGRLVYESHEGLSKLYEVSCDELDLLVSTARENKVTGARMMGGGFGGCTINLVQKSKQESLEEEITMKYEDAFRKIPLFYTVNTADGTHRINR